MLEASRIGESWWVVLKESWHSVDMASMCDDDRRLCDSCRNRTGSDRIDRIRPGSERIGPNRTGPDRKGSDMAGPDRTGSDRIGPDRPDQTRSGAEVGGLRFQKLETWNLGLETWNLKLETWILKLLSKNVSGIPFHKLFSKFVFGTCFLNSFPKFVFKVCFQSFFQHLFSKFVFKLRLQCVLQFSFWVCFQYLFSKLFSELVFKIRFQNLCSKFVIASKTKTTNKKQANTVYPFTLISFCPLQLLHSENIKMTGWKKSHLRGIEDSAHLMSHTEAVVSIDGWTLLQAEGASCRH